MPTAALDYLFKWLDFFFRNHMNDIYFGKTNDIFLSLRCINPEDAGKQEALKTELIEVLNKSAKIREWNKASSSIQYRGMLFSITG